MGIDDLLPPLPGGGSKDYKHSFYGALDKGSTVPLDAASALWQFAARHASDYLRGNLILLRWLNGHVYSIIYALYANGN